MRRSLPSVALFLLASAAVAQPPIPPAGDHRPGVVRAGDSLTVEAGRFADFKVDVPAGASVVWRFYPPPLQRATDLPPGRVIFAGEPGKSYTVTAVVIDFEKKSVVDTEVVVTFAGKKKDDDKKDDKKDDVIPPPVTSFKVMLVFESGQTHTSAQTAVLYGKQVEEYLTAKCDGGKAGWQRRDKDSDPAADTTAFKDVWALAKPRVSTVPCLVVSTGQTVFVEQPLPATPAEMIRVLDKYREGK